MYITLRKFLRQFLGIFNLGLIKKNDLKSLHKTSILYSNLAGKLPFYFEVEDLIEDPSIKILNRTFLINDSKSENGQDIFCHHSPSANKCKFSNIMSTNDSCVGAN